MEYKDELIKLESIKEIKDTEGVKEILNLTSNAINSCVSQLAVGYFIKSHIELVSICATLKANLELYKTISEIDDNIEAVKEIMKKKEE